MDCDKYFSISFFCSQVFFAGASFEIIHLTYCADSNRSAFKKQASLSVHNAVGSDSIFAYYYCLAQRASGACLHVLCSHFPSYELTFTIGKVQHAGVTVDVYFALLKQNRT